MTNVNKGLLFSSLNWLLTVASYHIRTGDCFVMEMHHGALQSFLGVHESATVLAAGGVPYLQTSDGKCQTVDE